MKTIVPADGSSALPESIHQLELADGGGVLCREQTLVPAQRAQRPVRTVAQLYATLQP